MKILIDIPKDLYEKIENHNVPLPDIDVLCQSVLDGGIVYSEEKECVPIEGVPLEEMVN